MAIKRKRCRYCKDWFIPEPNIKNQVACGKALCRKASSKEAQKKWLEKNPDYFKGRYPDTKEWLKKHPGYLKRYRQSHPEYVKNNRIKQKQQRKRRSER